MVAAPLSEKYGVGLPRESERVYWLHVTIKWSDIRLAFALTCNLAIINLHLFWSILTRNWCRTSRRRNSTLSHTVVIFLIVEHLDTRKATALLGVIPIWFDIKLMDGRTEKPLFLATLLYWQKRRNQINVAVSETMSQVFTAEFSFAIESRDGIAKKKTVRLVVLLESLLYDPIDLVLMIKHRNNQIKHH